MVKKEIVMILNAGDAYSDGYLMHARLPVQDVLEEIHSFNSLDIADELTDIIAAQIMLNCIDPKSYKEGLKPSAGLKKIARSLLLNKAGENIPALSE